MKQYITTIKDLVAQALTNGSEIKAKAENGDALSYFQMGIIHLLGVNAPVDFNEAKQYFCKESLSDNAEANRFLGFISECEGSFAEAFQYYAKAVNASTGKERNNSIYKNVYEERKALQEFLYAQNLPKTVLNKEVTAILKEYIEDENKKADASVKIALVCNDEVSCLNAAQTLFEDEDYYSAMKWLQYGNISESNSLYALIREKIFESKQGLNLPDEIEPIEIDGDSLLSRNVTNNSYVGIKSLCDDVAVLCKKEWQRSASSLVATVKKYLDEAEAARIKEEAARLRRLQEAEAARIRKEQEEAARLRRLQEAEAARIRKEQEEAARLRRLQEAEAARLRIEQEKAAHLRNLKDDRIAELIEKKRKKTFLVNIILLLYSIPMSLFFICSVFYSKEPIDSNLIIGLLSIEFILVIAPCGAIKLISLLENKKYDNQINNLRK